MGQAEKVETKMNELDPYLDEYEVQTESPKVDDALVEAISVRVLEKMQPWMDRMLLRESSGLLIGTYAIGVYLNRPKLRPYTLLKWYTEYGMPLSKGRKGRWEAMKSNLDKWFFDRGMVMRKAAELGYIDKTAHWHTTNKYFAPECLTDEEHSTCVREMQKDQVRRNISE